MMKIRIKKFVVVRLITLFFMILTISIWAVADDSANRVRPKVYVEEFTNPYNSKIPQAFIDTVWKEVMNGIVESGRVEVVDEPAFRKLLQEKEEVDIINFTIYDYKSTCKLYKDSIPDHDIQCRLALALKDGNNGTTKERQDALFPRPIERFPLPSYTTEEDALHLIAFDIRREVTKWMKGFVPLRAKVEDIVKEDEYMTLTAVFDYPVTLKPGKLFKNSFPVKQEMTTAGQKWLKRIGEVRLSNSVTDSREATFKVKEGEEEIKRLFEEGVELIIEVNK